jgi:type I restriction enzyme R subunit
VPGIPVGTDMDAFRRKARLFLKPYETHIAVLKVKRNEPLTPTDLKELERIFLEAGVDETALDALQGEGGLPRFVRMLVGLDRETAKGAFSEFLHGRRLSANQLQFLDLVIDYLTARGVMEPSLLYESPFTDFDRNGVEGVFEHGDVVRLVQVLRDIEPKHAA